MSETYIVLGMHRGGTSITAALLHHSGVEMLHGTPISNNRESPIGYYENRKIMGTNDKILSVAGGSWKHPPSPDDIIYAGNKMNKQISTLISSFDASPKWGIKDPRLCLTYPVYHPYIDDPRFIIVVRDPEANYQGFKKVRFAYLHQRYRTKEYFFNLYERYLECADKYSNGHPRLIVQFENYFTGTKEIKKIRDFVGSKVPLKELKNLINPKHKHH